MPPRFLPAAVCVCVCLSASMVFAQAQSNASANFENAGQAAQLDGRFQDAFAAYLSAYQALPNPPLPDDDRRLRERIIRVVQRLDTQPAIPAEAGEHASKADQLLNAEAILGTSAGASSQAAVIELRSAVRAAPWWAAPTMKLATVLQKLQRVDEALLNLNLYKLADPVGYLETLDRSRAKTPAAPAVPMMNASAEVYVYWPPQKMGSGQVPLQCNAIHVADLSSRHYVVFKVPAGLQTVQWYTAKVPMQFEGGRTYYVRASAEGFPAKPVMRLLPAEEAISEMKEKNVELNDPQKTYTKECRAPAARKGGQE